MHNMYRNDMFSVPVFSAVYKQAESLKSDAIKFMKSQEQKYPLQIPYSTNGYTSFRNGAVPILEEDLFAGVKSFILDSVNQIFLNLEMEGTPFITGSWFNINRKHSYHTQHTHLPEIWSGIYYVSANEDDAPIIFYDTNRMNSWPWTKSNLTSRVTIPPNTGIAHFFPSFLTHEVAQQTNNSERYSISFNLHIKEAYGRHIR